MKFNYSYFIACNIFSILFSNQYKHVFLKYISTPEIRPCFWSEIFGKAHLYSSLTIQSTFTETDSF